MNFKINSRIYILTIVFIVIIFILLCAYKNIENYVPYTECGESNMFRQGYTYEGKRDPLLPVSCNRNNQQGIYIRNCWNTVRNDELWDSYLNWEDIHQKNADGTQDYETEKLLADNPVSPQYLDKKNNTKWEIIPVPGKVGTYHIRVLDAGYNSVIDDIFKPWITRKEKKKVYLYAVDGNAERLAKPNNNPPGILWDNNKNVLMRYHYIDFIETNMNMHKYPYLKKYTWETQGHDARDWDIRREWKFIKIGDPGQTTTTEGGFFRIHNVGTKTDLFLIDSSWHENDAWWDISQAKSPTPDSGALFGVGDPGDKLGSITRGKNNLWYLEKVSDYETKTTEDIIERQKLELNNANKLREEEEQKVENYMKECMMEDSTFPDLCAFKASRDCMSRSLSRENCIEWANIKKDDLLIQKENNCKDNNIEKCRYWAEHEKNYCKLPRSKKWMNRECKTSCKVDECPYEIPKIPPNLACSDHPKVDCEKYAYAGECKGSNSVFMNEYCKKSCNISCDDNKREIVIKTKKNNNDMDLCIDHQGSKEGNGTPVHMWDCDDALAAKGWFWGRQGSQGRELKNSNGYCLDHGAEDNNVYMWKCDPPGPYVHENRQWQFDGQTLKAPSREKKKCLDLDKDQYKKGQWPTLYNCDEEGQSTHDNRKWIIKDAKT